VSGGEQQMRALLSGDRPFTAVCCYNDLMAIGALRALRAAGRRVPDEVSVIGFDDIDLAAYAEPPLTTIAQDITSLGRWAVDRLRTLIATSVEGRAPAQPVIERLPVRLVVRSTTGRAMRVH
jgi:DNA-binding LacI/PurR family transcriptional regulator